MKRIKEKLIFGNPPLQGLSPAEVIEGYEKACEKALEILPELVCHTLEDMTNRDVGAACRLSGALLEGLY